MSRVVEPLLVLNLIPSAPLQVSVTALMTLAWAMTSFPSWGASLVMPCGDVSQCAHPDVPALPPGCAGLDVSLTDEVDAVFYFP